MSNKREKELLLDLEKLGNISLDIIQNLDAVGLSDKFVAAMINATITTLPKQNSIFEKYPKWQQDLIIRLTVILTILQPELRNKKLQSTPSLNKIAI